MKKRSNRRSQKTRKEITEAFLALLAEKPVRSITVKELADRADITRATFYAHFADIYDLLEQTRTEAISHILSLIDKAIPLGDVHLFTLEFFTYFDENADLFNLIMGENGDISFIVSAMRELREAQIMRFSNEKSKMVQRFEADSDFDYKFIYLSGGVLHVLTEWFTQDKRLPVEEIAAITANFIESTVNYES